MPSHYLYTREFPQIGSSLFYTFQITPYCLITWQTIFLKETENAAILPTFRWSTRIRAFVFSENSHPEEALQYCKRIFQYHFTEYFLYPVSSHNKDVSQCNKDTRQQPYCIRQQPYQMSPCRQGRNKPPYLPLIFTLFLRTENCEDSLREICYLWL